MRLRTALPVTLTLALMATTVAAAVFLGVPPQPLGPAESINGAVISPGVERLSYVSPRYYGVRPAYDACMKRSQGAAPKRQDCAEAELTHQDDRLNRAYKGLVADLGEFDKHAAVDAQRAWIAFRDKDCAARAGRFGSNAGPATESICLVESTAYRAQQLEDWHTSSAAFDIPNFAGHWLYTQSCGYEHSVELHLTQAGNTVTGHWGEGTRISGSSGSLRGEIDSGRLSVQYCEGDDRAGYTKCPAYDPKSTDQFMLRAGDLVRYRGSGQDVGRRFERDVVLHRVASAQPTITDPHCPDGDQ